MADTTEVRGHVKTERTRKSLKLQQAVATITVATGIVLLIMSSQAEVPANGYNALAVNGWLTFMGGIIWNLFVRMMTWWHHG
jgi:hypothetical protein